MNTTNTMAVSPVVTGISPKEGPPGTKITIRGENFGQKSSDLVSVIICGCDCTLSADWKSSNKIIARSGPEKGKGDIIVTTKTGGVGTCTVQFRAYHETIGPTKESAVWVEEAPMLTLSWCRRSLSPTAYQQEDPLGLSVEGNENKIPEDDLNELFPNGSGDLASKNFDPGWFLLEQHHTTNFDDLKAGLSYLRRRVDGQREGQLSFLKSNVGSVLDQLDMLAKLKVKLEENSFNDSVEKKIEISKEEAHKLFQEVLARRERADATRNALTVLTRFKFLFCLPSVIEKNVHKGDFDVIINDYTRVKNLFGNKDIHVFKKAMVEIENRISQAREALMRKLEEVPGTLEENIKLIRNLAHLEMPGDPAWMSIEYFSNYLMSAMNDLKDKYIILESSESAKKNKVSAKGLGLGLGLDGQGAKPHRILCVEDLIDLMELKFPDLWKLGQMYFGSELYGPPDIERHNPFKRIVLSVTDHFCLLLRAAIAPHTMGRTVQNRQAYGIWSNSGLEVVVLWLPHCLRYLRSCYGSLVRIDLPSDVLDILSRLLYDLRLQCVSTIFKQAADNVNSFDKLENWTIDITEIHGGITDLPNLCRAKFHEVIQLIDDSVRYGDAREVVLTENSAAKKEILSLIFQLFTNFIQVLEKLVSDNSDEHSERPTIVSQLVYTSEVNKASPFGAITWEQRLLAVVCNCQYTADVVLPDVFELMKAQSYQITDEFTATVRNLFIALSHRILEQYNELKCDPLVGTIEPSMYVFQFDWDTSFEPTDIKPYAKEIIINLIGVRSELYRVPRHLVQKIMSKVADTVAEELARLMSCVKEFSLAGSIQARADVSAVKEATKSYVTKRGAKFYDEAFNSIPPLTEEGQNLVLRMLRQFNSDMRFQLSSLFEVDARHSSPGIQVF